MIVEGRGRGPRVFTYRTENFSSVWCFVVAATIYVGACGSRSDSKHCSNRNGAVPQPTPTPTASAGTAAQIDRVIR